MDTARPLGGLHIHELLDHLGPDLVSVFEPLDLVGRHAPEVVVERDAGFQLFAVDEDVPSSFLRWNPEMKSYTSFEIAVF